MTRRVQFLTKASSAESPKMSEGSPKAARALRGGGADRKLLTPAKMLVPSRSKSSSANSAQAEIIRNIRAEGSKIRSTMVAELRSSVHSDIL